MPLWHQRFTRYDCVIDPFSLAWIVNFFTSGVSSSFHQFLNNSATFWKWLLVMDKLTNFCRYFCIFMNKLRNCTYDKFWKRLWKTSLLEFFYYRSIYLSIVWVTMFSWFLICFVKISKKPSASFFIFSGQYKPKKHQIYYSWIIRLIPLSVLGINDKFRNTRSGNHHNIISWN